MIPVLETSRLILRPFSLDDAKDVQRLAGDPKIAATTLAVPHPYLDGLAEAWIQTHQKRFNDGHGADWAITLKSTRQLVGCMGLSIFKDHHRAEIGYWIAADFWGQGICTEASRATVDFAFQKLNLNKITARHMSSNPASGKVMQKFGMIREGVLLQDLLKNGRFEDSVVYGLTLDQYKNSQNSAKSHISF